MNVEAFLRPCSTSTTCAVSTRLPSSCLTEQSSLPKVTSGDAQAEAQRFRDNSGGIESLLPAICFVNFFPVFLQDLLPLDLLCRCGETLRGVSCGANELTSCTYVLWVPLLLSQYDSINHLNACKTSITSCLLELFKHKPIKLFVVNQFFDRLACNAVGRCKLL